MAINLDKSGDKTTIDLTKRSEKIHVNLNWSVPEKVPENKILTVLKSKPTGYVWNMQDGQYFWHSMVVIGVLAFIFPYITIPAVGGYYIYKKVKSAGPSAPDLDLGCMFELKSGVMGVLQPLGNSFGSESSEPYIFLDKDDRSGAASDGENMYVVKPESIKRIMFFAFIYEGAADFNSVNAHMTFKIPGHDSITLQLDNTRTARPFCAGALVENNNGIISVTKEGRYFTGHEEADQFYRFGFNWTNASKD